MLRLCLPLLAQTSVLPPAVESRPQAPPAPQRADTARVRQLQAQADSLSKLSPQALALT
jgi:hypothetical protein